MSWQQLQLHTAHAEFAEEILLANGALSVTISDAADVPILEPGPGETPLWPRSRVQGLFAEAHPLAPVLVAIAELLPDADRAEALSEILEDQDWVRECLKHVKPMQFGERLWVCPQGHSVPASNPVVVKLDPGLAFGTGTHPTTALCLRWLDAHPPRGGAVLDYGCGSGILAIAALKLGAESALAIDLDPQALVASRANAQANAVDAQLRTGLPGELPGELPEGRYPIILANILAGPLIALAPTLCAQLAPGGQLVLSGLLSRQVDEVCAAYAPWLQLKAGGQEDDWIRLDGQRPGG